MHTIRNYIMAESLEQAWELNQKGRNNVIIGGNLWLKMGNRNILNAIDLSTLGLDRIEEDESGFRIGCMATLRDIEMHEGLNKEFQNLFKEAVRHIVGVQFRNCATVGGSIFPKLGFSDVLTAFLACDTQVILYKKGEVSLREFIYMPLDNDILTHIYVKKDGRKTAYESFRMTETDFPTLTCAMAMVDGRFETVLGARPKHAEVVIDEELADSLSKEDVASYAKRVIDKLQYGSNIRGSKQYRKQLSKVLISRCISRLRRNRQMIIELFINEKKIQAETTPDQMLLDFLREQGYKSMKRGCDTGNCGLCTVWMDEKPVLSCSIPAVRAAGHKITTLEGVQEEAAEFSDYLAKEGADQCGYCSPGMIMNVLALKREIPNPTMQQVKEYLAGNLCRCTGYQGQYRALAKYFGVEE